MRIETVNGRNLVCGHIFPANELEVGQVWAPADGSDRVVTITKIDGNIIYYNDPRFGDFDKDAFSFQCRYGKVVD